MGERFILYLIVLSIHRTCDCQNSHCIHIKQNSKADSYLFNVIF